MEPSMAAIVLTEAAWEQWIGAVLRAERSRLLVATTRPRRRGTGAAARSHPRTRRSLLWMLAISAAGYWLLR